MTPPGQPIGFSELRREYGEEKIGPLIWASDRRTIGDGGA